MARNLAQLSDQVGPDRQQRCYSKHPGLLLFRVRTGLRPGWRQALRPEPLCVDDRLATPTFNQPVTGCGVHADLLRRSFKPRRRADTTQTNLRNAAVGAPAPYQAAVGLRGLVSTQVQPVARRGPYQS